MADKKAEVKKEVKKESSKPEFKHDLAKATIDEAKKLTDPIINGVKFQDLARVLKEDHKKDLIKEIFG